MKTNKISRWVTSFGLLISFGFSPAVAAEKTISSRTSQGHETKIYADERKIEPPALVHRMIRVKKGDSLSALTAKYLWPLVHQLNKDQVKNPNVIEPGQWLLIPAISDSAPKRTQDHRMVDVIYASKNEVSFNDGRSRKNLEQGDELLDLGRIESKAGYLTAGMGDGSRVRVKPNSSINFLTLEQIGQDDWANKSKIDRGRAEFSKTNTDTVGMTRFSVDFPTGKARGESRSFAVGVGRDDITRIEVYRDSLDVKSKQGDLNVPEGKGVLVGGRNFDVALMTLPTAVEGMESITSKDGQQINFTWRPVVDAKYYVLTLAEDIDMNKVTLRTSIYDGTSYVLKWTKPDASLGASDIEYFWTVQAINASGLHGYPSAVNRFDSKE